MACYPISINVSSCFTFVLPFTYYKLANVSVPSFVHSLFSLPSTLEIHQPRTHARVPRFLSRSVQFMNLKPDNPLVLEIAHNHMHTVDSSDCKELDSEVHYVLLFVLLPGFGIM